MSKFHGYIGFSITKCDDTGIWTSEYTEQKAYGEYVKNSVKLDNGSVVNNNISLANSISIVANPYTMEHLNVIKYVRIGDYDTKWTVNSIDIQYYPRLILSLGGVYNA